MEDGEEMQPNRITPGMESLNVRDDSEKGRNEVGLSNLDG
jgi:hypothetical protein